MIKKIVSSFYWKLYQSRYVRYVLSYRYRILFSKEHEAVSEFVENRGGNIVIAITASETYQFSHIKPLYDELAKDLSYSIILIASNPEKMQSPVYQKFLEKNNYRVNKDVFSYIWLSILKPDIFIETAITSYRHLCPAITRKILLAHSVSSIGFSKDHAHIRNAVEYDYVVSTGPYQKKVLELAADQFKVTLPEVFHGGFIRGDLLAAKNAGFDRLDFLEKCGLADRKTVLFAPTWGEFSATAEWIDPVVDLCVELGLNLMVKLHPHMLGGQSKWKTAGIDWHNKLDTLRGNKGVHVCGEFDVEEYMLAADIMLTDVSSVGLEYMFLGKPVFFLPAPRFFEIFGKDKPIFWLRNGLEVQDIVELKERLVITDGEPEHDPDFYIRKLSFHPGKAVTSIGGFIKTIASSVKK